MKKYSYIIIGAGISGITLAERLSKNTKKNILIIEKRNHIGGNCFDTYDNNHVLIHKYGPHIFHTKHKKVWDYLSKFSKWNHFKHKVITYVNGKYLPMPVNRNTLNVFFNIKLKNEKDVISFLEAKRDKTIKKISNSKDVVLSKYGQEIYDNFVKNYTKKQWDLYPEELDRSVLERLPVRYDNNPYYFNDKYQGVPKYGYTKMFEKMINKPNIHILLQTDYKQVIDKFMPETVFISSPIDEFFNYKYGKLKYRCIKFKFESYNKKSFQRNSVVNYPNTQKYTRITEMKKLTGQISQKTTICKEYPTWQGEPSYPVPQEEQQKIYSKYIALAQKNKKIIFIGRLGLYSYLNMDIAVKNILDMKLNYEKK